MFIIMIGAIFGLAGLITPGVIIMGVGTIVLFLPGNLFEFIPIIHIGRTITITQPKQSLTGTIYQNLMDTKVVQKVSDDTKQVAISGSIKTGELAKPYKLAKQVAIAFILSIFIAGAVTTIGILFVGDVLFALSWLIPVIIIMIPRLNIMFGTSAVMTNYDAEFAYFLAYLQVSSLLGFSLYNTMLRLIGKNIIVSSEKDAVILKKLVNADGYSETMALNKLAEKHTHEPFKSFLYGYDEIAQSNPTSLDQYVTRTAEEEFDKIVAKDESKVGKISAMFTYGAMAMIMIPVLLMIMMFIQSEVGSIEMITLVIYVIPILFTVFVYIRNPTTQDGKYNTKNMAFIGVIPGIAWFIIGSFVELPFGIYADALSAVSLMIAIPCLINGKHVDKQLAIWNSTVSGFPRFARDLTERLKVEPNFIKSVEKIILAPKAEARYGSFASIINDIKVRQFMVSDKKLPIFYDDNLGSKRLKLFMFIMEAVMDGGQKKSIKAVERIYEFSSKLIKIKNSLDSTLKLSSILLYIAPIAFFFTMMGLVTVLSSFASNTPDFTNLPPEAKAELGLFINAPDLSASLDTFKPAVLIMSFCAGTVISRLVYSTLKATLSIGITMFVSFIILAGWDIFVGLTQTILADVF